MSAVAAIDVAACLRGYRFHFVGEEALQGAIGATLEAEGYAALREQRLSHRDRIDFMVGRVGIEVKVDGSVSAVARQLARYAESDLLDELILVTACARHGRVGDIANGKPVHLVSTFRSGGL